MARPASISNEQILEAARAVFLAHGFGKASTVEIAKRAGISEGSIFNRFPTKDDLFHAAMDNAQPPAFDLDRYVGRGDLRKNLAKIAVDSIQFLSALLPTLLLRWSEREAAGGATVVCTRPRDILAALTAFFQKEKRLRRLGADPAIAARLFMGAVWNYCFLQTVAGYQSMPVKTYARKMVAGLWQGIAPKDQAR